MNVVMTIVKWYSIILLIILELSTIYAMIKSKSPEDERKYLVTSVAMMPILLLSLLA